MIRDFEQSALTPEIIYWETQHQRSFPRPHHEEVVLDENALSFDWASLILHESDLAEKMIKVYPPDYYKRDVMDREELIQTGVIDGNS